ncbi:thiaminase [Gracilibacillus halotolerans]|uniref:Aminopyrimidine aminohydrolase n=1 Tax=Gracilibacillus halotolerans TaxID=74386 RepID=A0A841RS87_9BACI|nr:thiaminase [Gracilibacillus halotolerans]
MINDIAKDKPEHELKRIEDIFVRTSYFEYMFWEMAEEVSMWPVKDLAKN